MLAELRPPATSEGTPTTLATFVYAGGSGGYIDDVVSMRRDLVGSGLAALDVGGLSQSVAEVYFHTDDMFTVAALTDSSGNVAERYHYDDYGAPKLLDAGFALLSAAANGRIESVVGNPHGFTGREWDAESGLWQCRYRYLSSSMGRFVSRDAMGTWMDDRAVGGSMVCSASNSIVFADDLGLKSIRPSITTPTRRTVQPRDPVRHQPHPRRDRRAPRIPREFPPGYNPMPHEKYEQWKEKEDYRKYQEETFPRTQPTIGADPQAKPEPVRPNPPSAASIRKANCERARDALRKLQGCHNFPQCQLANKNGRGGSSCATALDNARYHDACANARQGELDFCDDVDESRRKGHEEWVRRHQRAADECRARDAQCNGGDQKPPSSCNPPNRGRR